MLDRRPALFADVLLHGDCSRGAAGVKGLDRADGNAKGSCDLCIALPGRTERFDLLMLYGRHSDASNLLCLSVHCIKQIGDHN